MSELRVRRFLRFRQGLTGFAFGRKGFLLPAGEKCPEGLPGDLRDRLPVLRLQRIGGEKPFSQVVRHGLGGLLNGPFSLVDSVQGNLVEKFRADGEQDGDLGRNRYGGKFRLFQRSPNPPSVGHGFSGIIIEPGSKTGEGLEFLELGVGELQIARNGPESRELGLPSDPGDRFPHINGGKHPKLEKGRGGKSVRPLWR